MTYVINPSRFGGGSSSLLTDLVSWWSMDETSGTRADSHGSNDLAETGTVGSVTGKLGNAADVSNASMLSCTSADLSGGNRDFTIACWVNFDSLPNGDAIISKGTTGVPDATNWEYLVGFINSGKIRFYTSDGSSSFVTDDTSLSVDTWYFVVCWHDATAGSINICINDGTVYTNAAPDTPSEQGDDVFHVFRYGNAYLDGSVDEVAFWSRLLTSDERTALYNSGSGIAYPG